MACKHWIVTVLLLWSCGSEIQAQFQLPAFDVELKANQILIPGAGNGSSSTQRLDYFEATSYHVAAHWQIGQHIGVGGFLTKSFRGTDRLSSDGNNEINNPAEMLAKGIDLRVSTGRAKKWRKYLALNYASMEMVEDHGDYRLAGKTNAIGANIGFMRKLSNKLYLTVFELGVKSLSSVPFWFDSNNKIVIDAKMGLLYNIGKRK
jgi:hypothetical protein